MKPISPFVPVDVDADDAKVLDRDLEPPELSAQLAVHLQDDLLDARLEPLLVGQRLLHDDLARHRALHVAQLFDGGVAVGALSGAREDRQNLELDKG